MNENGATWADWIVNETTGTMEVFTQILPWNIHDTDHFVLDLIWEARIQASQHLQNVCDAVRFE